MAESSSSTASAPALPSTADQVPYVPVSWMAVGAAAVAGLLVVLLLFFGFYAFRWHRPMLETELFALALAAIILSFVARRVVRNSEGTRTGALFGIDLPNAAWWTGLVLGLGYLSYYFAIDYSVRKDAQNEVKTWADYVFKGDPESLTRAFYRTQDPSQRRQIRPDDAAQMEGRWRNDFIGFRQCDLVRMAARNTDNHFELGGLQDWSFKQTGVECVFTAKLTNAEGTFPIAVPLKAVEAATEGAGRQWQVLFTAAGYIQKEQAQLTPYGWFVGHLSITGTEAGRNFISACSNRETRPYAVLDFAEIDAQHKAFLRPLTADAQKARTAVIGLRGEFAWRPGPEFYNYTADLLFALPGGARPSPQQSSSFRDAWDKVGIVRAGERLRDSTDLNEQLSFADSHIEIRVPIEIPISASKGEVKAARGRVVLVCKDPAILSELKRLRAEANPADSTPLPPKGLMDRIIPWRVLWIESDLKAIHVVQQRPGQSPGGPGGPGGPAGPESP
jgi:hypothetical protein